MALTYSQAPVLGSEAPDFHLRGTDGKFHGLSGFASDPAIQILIVAFICNHCPYVKAIRGRLQKVASQNSARGVQMVGINSNDPVRYPDDNFEAMQREVIEHGYTFPYLQDATQEVAKAYRAVCTPDFFVYAKREGKFLLEYAGRLDNSWKDESAVTHHELQEAVDALLLGQKPNAKQQPSMGCSIKWK